MKDILQVEEAYGDLSILMFWLFFFVFFDYACMYEEYLHGLTSSLSGGQTLVKHVSLHPFLHLLHLLHLLHSLFTC